MEGRSSDLAVLPSALRAVGVLGAECREDVALQLGDEHSCKHSVMAVSNVKAPLLGAASACRAAWCLFWGLVMMKQEFKKPCFGLGSHQLPSGLCWVQQVHTVLGNSD